MAEYDSENGAPARFEPMGRHQVRH